MVTKEYIKVKPRGFYFHEGYYLTIQGLLNWFKEKCKDKEYLRFQKKQKSPRAKIPLAPSD